MISPKKNYALARSTAFSSLAATLFFVLIEWLKTCRSGQWAGVGLTEISSLLFGLGIYGTILFTLAYLLARASLRITKGHFPINRHTIFCPLGTALILWGLLTPFREISPTLEDALIIISLTTFAITCLLAPQKTGITLAQTQLLIILVLASGFSAIAATGSVYLFHIHREYYITFYPAIWMLIAGITGFPVWACHGRFINKVRAIHTLLILTIPPLLSFWITLPPSTNPNDTRPNLILVISDALRADHLNLYNGPVPTPNLDRIAQQAATFNNAYSLAPWTMPSMTAMFASNYPPSLTPGLPPEAWLEQIWRYHIPENYPTLAQALHDQGYATAAITANALLGVMPGMMNGFDTKAAVHPIMLRPEGPLCALPFMQSAIAALFPRFDAIRPHNTTAAITRYARAWIHRCPKPFFLWVHYMDPHAPCDPPARFRPTNGPWPFFYPYPGGEQWSIPLLGPNFATTPAEQDYIEALYNGEIQYIDEQTGILLNTLKKRGLRNNTYFSFTADHGEELWDHGNWGHGHTLYNELIHVPWLITGPGIQPNRYDQPVSAIDLMPTLAGLVSMPVPPEWKGNNLAPILRGENITMPTSPVFTQATNNRCWPNPLHAVVGQQWKLIREAGPNTIHLYNLQDDPLERNDIAVQAPTETHRLETILDEWRNTFPSTFADTTNPSNSRDDVLQNLRAIGYLQ